MRVLFVSDYPHLPAIRGGLQTTTHDLCLAIGLAGGEASVLCGLNLQGTQVPGDTYSNDSLGYRCTRVSMVSQLLPSVAADWNADAIVVQSGTSLTRMVLAALDSGRPTAVYLHNVEMHQLHGTLLPDPSLLYLANSDFTAERWRALCGLHCEVVPPVIRAENYIAGATGSKVLFVNPVPIKGVEIMFALAAQFPSIPFLVVESWELEPHWRQWCRSRANALGNVEWLEPTDDMRAVYAQSKLLLMPSVWEESFGRTVIEAQLNGLPVLASQRGALLETVGAGGMNVDVHAPIQEWAAALEQLLSEYEAFSASAREQAMAYAAATPLTVAHLMSLLVQHSAH